MDRRRPVRGQFDLVVRAAGYNPGEMYTEVDLEAISAFGVGSEMFTGEVLVDETTAAAVGAGDFDPAGRRPLKGFTEPVTLYALRVEG